MTPNVFHHLLEIVSINVLKNIESAGRLEKRKTTGRKNKLLDHDLNFSIKTLEFFILVVSNLKKFSIL